MTLACYDGDQLDAYIVYTIARAKSHTAIIKWNGIIMCLYPNNLKMLDFSKNLHAFRQGIDCG
ncbi:hypothetical protein GCM10009409_01160 [Shewanella saliphila]|uniref:UvrD-like helicase C-terminal domain-containing protein n=1 Tax=Shewanella saliphila TaxID=2282698 RepID=A0ABQ2Q168_9GAMM|nr:hypothetical protein GCM10009409_01160 [Shewanella saliphila]